jgi:hypothetical protein
MEMALNDIHVSGLGKLATTTGKRLVLLATALAIAACSSDSGEDESGASPPPPPPPVNQSPTADAGADLNVGEMTVVNLFGSVSDPNDASNTLTTAWMQTGGTPVTLNAPDSLAPSFMAPDVAAGSPEVLTFELTVTDPGGLAATDSISVTVQEPAATVTISGTLQYEFPPPNLNCNGLNYGAIELRPIRQATVQLLDAAGTAVIDSTTSNDLGQYSLNVDASTDVIIRVRAESLRSGALSWDFQVRNNVDTSDNPPPLDQRPIYVMDSVVFDSGVTNQTRNLNATTGWGGINYSGPRVAAPFAILDTIYEAVSFVAATDPNADFPPLDAFWSPDNKAASPTDVDAGDLPTSFYDGQSQLFLLGMDGVDTEEFDDHIIVHEWGHYFEDNFSRSDNIGGRHSVNFADADILDKRVAFGEGWATALSGMALNDPIYCDTSGTANSQGFSLNIENRNAGTSGWFNEVSILQLIYDLWDTDNDGADTSSIGFGPIYDVLTGPQTVAPAFTSIFSFATYLKQQGTGQNAFIDALLAEHDIVANGIDEFGSTETNDGPGSPQDVFPMYTDITLGNTVNICVNSQFDSGRDGNKLSEHRYLRLELPTTRPVTFSMTANPAPSQPSDGFDCTADEEDPENREHSDPDYLVWRDGQLYWIGFSCEPNSEVSTTNGSLLAGTYVIDINDFRHEDEESPAGYPERVCFDFRAD